MGAGRKQGMAPSEFRSSPKRCGVNMIERTPTGQRQFHVRWLMLALLLIVLAPLWHAGAECRAQSRRQVPVDSLIYDLKNPDPVRRKEAARLLGENKIQRAVPDLVATANDPEAQVRREVVTALDRLLDIRALPAFVSLSRDSEKDIRDKSITGLINLYLPRESGLVVGLTKVATFLNPWSDEWADVIIDRGMRVDPSVLEALETRLQDEDEDIRSKAARALGILRGLPAAPSLAHSIAENQSNSVKFEAIRALRKMGDPGQCGALLNFRAYVDGKVRNEAVYTLGRLRCTGAVGELTNAFEKESNQPTKLIDARYRALLLDALAFIGDPASGGLFYSERLNPDDTLRLHAFEGLARIGDPAMITEISRLWLQEKNPKIKTAQTYVIYRMGRQEFLDELVNRLADNKSSGEAMQYLVELSATEMPALLAQIRNRKVDVREKLAELFGIIGDDRAIPALQELSKDRRGKVARIANDSMRRIISARTVP